MVPGRLAAGRCVHGEKQAAARARPPGRQSLDLAQEGVGRRRDDWSHWLAGRNDPSSRRPPQSARRAPDDPGSAGGYKAPREILEAPLPHTRNEREIAVPPVLKNVLLFAVVAC